MPNKEAPRGQPGTPNPQREATRREPDRQKNDPNRQPDRSRNPDTDRNPQRQRDDQHDDDIEERE
jgi:hypothetical protein